jgi:DNA-binding phage protein
MARIRQTANVKVDVPVSPRMRTDLWEQVESRIIELKGMSREKIVFDFALRVKEDPRLKDMLAAKQKAGSGDAELLDWMKNTVDSPTEPMKTGKLDTSGFGGINAGNMLKAALPAAALTALGAELISATKSAIEFESGLTQVANVSGASKSQIDAYKQELLSIAPAYGQSTSAIMPAFKQLMAAGAPLKNATEIFEVALKSATTNGEDSSKSVSLLTTVVNGMGDSFMNAGGIRYGQAAISAGI